MLDFKASIIIPVYNGSLTIALLVDELQTELLNKVANLEIVLINDGSTDNSATICRDLAQKNDNVVFLNLSKNFGQNSAIIAGLNYCKGDVAVIIDDDFQNPPSKVILLLNEINNGKDVVYSSFVKKNHNIIRNLGSRFANYCATKLLDKPKKLYLSSFKAMNRFLIDEIIKYKGSYPYIDGLIFRTTHNYGVVEVPHNKRESGKSGYTIVKLISLWTNIIINFSISPLRIASITGFFISIFGLLMSVWLIIEKINNPSISAGWTSLIVVIMLLSGVQMMILGVVGEYLGRLFLNNNSRPQFVVREKILTK